MPARAAAPKLKLLLAFEDLFRGQPYLHRRSNLGNEVARILYEDLYSGGYSTKLKERMESGTCVVNIAGSTHGVKARRGDGTFGTVVPGTAPARSGKFSVWHGVVALTQIGAEVKVLATAHLKQIDRVINDLAGSAQSFKKKSRSAITVGVAGVNYSQSYTGFEGTREYPRDHMPERALRDAEETSRRLEQLAAPDFDEFLLFKFKATNRAPYPFSWLDRVGVAKDYGAALVRIAGLYQSQF